LYFSLLCLVKAFILPYNRLMRLEEKVALALIQSQKSLAIAESCTGGLLTHRLTNIPGSSAFLKFTLIAYSNESKIKLLKIPISLIKKHGVVSQETAALMAKNTQKIFNTDFGVAITGIAGPAGATALKPVGLCFVAIATAQETLCLKCHFKGNRVNIKNQAATKALKLLSKFLY